MYISKCVATGFTRQKSNPDKNSVVVELQFEMDEWILMQSIAILIISYILVINAMQLMHYHSMQMKFDFLQ